MAVPLSVDLTGSFTVPAAPADVVCTFTNTRTRATVTLQKAWVNAVAGDTADLTVTSSVGTDSEEATAPAPAVTAAQVEVLSGSSVALAEALTSTADYATDLVCVGNDGTLTYTAGELAGSLAVTTTDAGTTIACTFTNRALRGTIVIVKNVAGANGTFQFTGGWLNPPEFSITTTGGTGSQTFTGVLAGSYPLAEIDPTPASTAPTSSVSIPTQARRRAPLTGTIDLDDDETVTCTFTNTQRSTIVIVKDAVPDGPQDFSFTGDLGDFTLDDDPTDDTFSNTFTSALLPAGTTHVVTESLVTGGTSPAWCAPRHRSTSTVTAPSVCIELGFGDTVTCTFTNTQRGSITIVKDAGARPPPRLHLQRGARPFTLDDDPSSGTSNTFTAPGLVPGTYTVTEATAPGWVQSGIECDDDTAAPAGTIDIVLPPGGDVTCTFTNTKLGSITIIKEALPDGSPQDFSFTGSLGEFTLDDDPASPTPDSFTDTDLPDGTYTVTETGVTGWDQQGIVCDNGTTVPAGTPTVAIQIALGADVTCTFTNSQQGSITVIKNAIPDASQDFTFTAQPSPPLANFTLDDDPDDDTQTNSRTFSGLPAGEYSITEQTVPGWDTGDPICTPFGRADPPEVTVEIDLPPGGHIVCTFTNIRRTSTLTLQKTWVDGAADDATELEITGLDIAERPLPATATATATGAPGDETSPESATTTVYAGETITLSEVLADANLGTYDTTLDCNGTPIPLIDLTGTITIPDTPVPTTCTFTNNRLRARSTCRKHGWAVPWVTPPSSRSPASSPAPASTRTNSVSARWRPPPAPHRAAFWSCIPAETVRPQARSCGAANAGTYDTHAGVFGSGFGPTRR